MAPNYKKDNLKDKCAGEFFSKDVLNKLDLYHVKLFYDQYDGMILIYFT